MGVILSSRHRLSSSAIPQRFRLLPDGRSTAAVIARMDAELRDAAPPGWEGETWTHQAEMFAEIGTKYGVISADTVGCFTAMPDDVGTCLEEITCHAGARMWAAGYRGAIVHGKPETYWHTSHLRQDGPAILLAACELLRNGSRAIVDWYLNAPCGGLCELHKSAGGPRACGSDSCIRADDETPCICACGGVNHGIGVPGFPRELLELDWGSIPVSQIGRSS